MRVALLLLVSACARDVEPADSGKLDGDDTETGADPACTATVTGLTPEDGALGVATGASVVATFSAPVTAADIDLDGVSGTVALDDDGTSATFTPDADLAAGRTYTVTASVCDSSAVATFTTEGDALPVDLTDRTYDVELVGEDLTWVAPALGSYLAPQLGTDRILFMVQAADTGSIDLVGAAGHLFRDETPAQYPCTYAIDFAPAAFSAHPVFAVGPLTAGLEASDVTFDLHDLTIAGTLAEDGTAATDVTITGLLDTRPLAEGLGLDICALATSFGDTCIACPDGGEGCLYLEVHDESAPWREGLWIDVAQDPTTDRFCD